MKCRSNNQCGVEADVPRVRACVAPGAPMAEGAGFVVWAGLATLVPVVDVIQPVPVDCVVSPWTLWQGCTAQCGAGSDSRSRYIIVKHQFGGRACPELNIIKTCQLRPCHSDSESMYAKRREVTSPRGVLFAHSYTLLLPAQSALCALCCSRDRPQPAHLHRAAARACADCAGRLASHNRLQAGDL